MDFARRPHLPAELEAHHRSDGILIPIRPLETHPEARPGSHVVVELGFCAILRHNQIHPSVTIVVTQSGPALFSVNFDAAFLARNGLETAFAIPAKPQPAPGIQAIVLGSYGKEILRDEDIFVSVAIDVSHGQAERRSPLGLAGQWHGL